MKMVQLSKVLLPVFFATFLTACDSEDNYTSNAAPNVELPDSVNSVNLDNNTAYRVTLAPNGNQLPQIGMLSVSTSGNKRLMLNDSNGIPTVSLVERDGVWFNTTDVNLPAKQLTIVSIEPINDAVVDIAMGDYVFNLSNDENARFSINNSSFIEINSGECTLFGEIKDPAYPGLFNFNATSENCLMSSTISNGILVVNPDDMPASFKLVYTQNGKVQSRYVYAL
ncbi:hypothetical protein [Thorsellia anophelis]|uniref:Uncharacterized protein n=1 Tax=Thorsellia anophelis DSM 18579 TaxID=1123402 RepID=A0A1I0ARS2_9GAMM|nr:hypothetical protein [Thorsellia anophelis]SES97097.1 hypothetical protein SAMN02583745_01036 [Thorsellia anophelis DSM 18579]